MFKYLNYAILFGILAISSTAFADNQTKIALAKKVVFSGNVSPYATSSLKQLLQKAHQINDREASINQDIGCEFFEHYYLGWGQDFSAQDVRNLKAKVEKSGTVKVTFNTGFSAQLVEMDMVCTANSCKVNDVRHGFSDNSKVLPKRISSSIRRDAQTMVNKNSCF